MQVFIVLLPLFYSANAFDPFFQVDKKFDRIIVDYLAVHKNFMAKSCRPGTEEKFWKLVKDYRGDGYYIPLSIDERLDRATVAKFLPVLKKKKDWISRQRELLKGKGGFRSINRELDRLDRVINRLLTFKMQYQRAKNKRYKKAVLKRSKPLYRKLQKGFRDLFKKIPFLLNYGFPNDHLKLRDNFEKYKFSKTTKGRIGANEIFFYRRIVQDGAQSRKHTKGDHFLRATLDTIALELEKERGLISENLRHDLSYAMEGIKQQLAYGRRELGNRMGEWGDRVGRTINFYQSLLGDGRNSNRGRQVILAYSKARHALENFVNQKKYATYQYWAKQSQLFQALYAMETILFNEVGDVDGKNALERKDIIKVVMNRRDLWEYNRLTYLDDIYRRLQKAGRKEMIKNRPWLNLMFKRGEFSFTYFFITGNVRIYCPDMTRKGRLLRRQNLLLALRGLTRPQEPFGATRYFSRASMQGRIDMAKVWKNYVVLPEQPGVVLKNQKRYLRRYWRSDYRYLYNFRASDGQLYEVLEMGPRLCVYSPKKKTFHSHRNPHLFRYFQKLR